ncbi:MAG TPA: DUF6786 family protein [Polyangiaceae bacterium]|jgi:hypothetical protein|nr:DUF6786 family protein [Polyangiaceae bacterium]
MRVERCSSAALVFSVACLTACREPVAPPVQTTPSATPMNTPTQIPSAEPVASSATPAPQMSGVSFDDDVRFLGQHGAVKVLSAESGAKIAISSGHQARVMTSAVMASGKSLGFINRAFIEAGKTGTPFDNYGGEDRFWLGPEGGQFGLYFPPQKPFTFDNWQTPHELQEGAWEITDESATSIAFSHTITVKNYGKREFKVHVEREIALLDSARASAQLGLPIPEGVHWVGFATTNRVTNAGKDPWQEKTGLLSIWILSMFAPVAGTRVIVPFDPKGTGEIVNDRYFGKVPADRLQIDGHGYLLFKCDGQYRSKIGLGPARAKNALGSYSEPAELLTLVLYTRPEGAKRYVNSMWELQKDPYAGDVVNSYNDGPPAPGKPALGGFYEIESSSPALALAPNESATHVQQTFHFTGPREALDLIARKVLGVGLSELPPG